MAGYLHLAAGEVACQLKKSPEIHVTASDTSLKIDNSKTRAQLDQFEIDTISPYGKSVQSHVGGLMSGEIKTTSNLSLMSETFPAINTACLMIHKINVKINIDPTIYIAREYKPSGCMYKAIMEHEKKHVQVDRMIINKYTALIVKALDTYFKGIGYKNGPMPVQSLELGQQQLVDANNKIVTGYAEKMNAERKNLQQQVDSLEEYDRVTALCQGRQ